MEASLAGMKRLLRETSWWEKEKMGSVLQHVKCGGSRDSRSIAWSYIQIHVYLA